MNHPDADGSKPTPTRSRNHFGHRTRRLHAHAINAFLAAASLPLFIAANTCSAETINLAGTFNNWSTQGNEWQMKQVDDTTFEFRHFWPAGHEEFKFAFNGSWDKHLGAARGNQLMMPGDNIELQIREPGYYRITLDTDSRTWTLKSVAPSQPVPILQVRRESLDTYLLDASNSLFPPTGHNRPTYRFAAERSDGAVSDQITLTAIDPRHTRLSIPAEGDYTLTLTMTLEGTAEKSLQETRHLGDGYELIFGAGKSQMLLPLDRHRWCTVVEPISVDSHPALRSLSPARTRPITIPDNLRSQRILIVADKRNNETQFKMDGWHEFVFRPRKSDLPRDTTAESVDLVGTFNGWRAGATPMRRDADGRFRSILELPDGIHHYKFLVNGSIFLEDHRSDARFRESDGNGGYNSGLLIGDDARAFGNAEPGKINTEALKHDPMSNRYFAPIASNVAGITVRTLASNAETVELICFSKHLRMRKAESAFGFDYWSIQIQLPPGSNEIRYSFSLVPTGRSPDEANSPKGEVSLEPGGAVSALIHHQTRTFVARMPKSFEAPDWAKRAMWYQIFPERFRNGDKSNDPPRTVPWTQKWNAPYTPGKNVAKGSPQDFVEKGTFFQYIFDRRYGGDLQGVREKLPYLRDLGVTAIYFNPVFQAESLHKYDATDYRHIDDCFGVAGSYQKLKGETVDPATWKWSDSDKVFLDFIADAHRMGFKVIIDGVFNHTGRDFWAFQDILKNGKKSQFADWFEIKSWEPFHYEAWDREDGSLPKLKHDAALGLAEPVREHLFAVTRRWMDPNGDGDPSDGVDGWRLDVASDINANFWRDWRKVVKETNPDAYIVAELWQQSQEWLDGNTFDAVMNYPFARRTLRFVINDKKASSPTQFRNEIDELHGWYRPQVNYVLQNLFDSHDTDRLASMCMNPDVEYDEANRVQDNGPDYNTDKPTPACYQKQKLLATIQMTFLGAPMVYYGDEVGMYGADDPSDRKPMLWADLPPNDDPDERIEPDVLDHYRRMIAIRNTYTALQLGDYEPVWVDDAKRIFAFTRSLGDQSILVVLNNSDVQHRVDVPVPWPDGAHVFQLDDPNQCDLVMPDAADPTARPTIRRNAKRSASKLKVESGRLHGKMLPPRSGAVFTVAAD